MVRNSVLNIMEMIWLKSKEHNSLIINNIKIPKIFQEECVNKANQPLIYQEVFTNNQMKIWIKFRQKLKINQMKNLFIKMINNWLKGWLDGKNRRNKIWKKFNYKQKIL